MEENPHDKYADIVMVYSLPALVGEQATLIDGILCLGVQIVSA